MEKKWEPVKLKLSPILPILNEKQRRLLVASEAKFYGRGGIQNISKITGISRQTIYRGIDDLKKNIDNKRIRNSGGGRKKLRTINPKLLTSIEKIIDPLILGDPESPLKWTCKSVRKLEDALNKLGFSVSYKTIANILHEEEYNLQSNRKTSEGKKDNPDRDQQFLYINKQAKKFLRQQEPVISVDTKKKELIGKYKNPGREWKKKGCPEKVLSHDFPDPKVSKAIPYGVYDVGNNTGWVNIGIDSDTAEFAVESIRQWWLLMGKKKYSKIKNLLICADSGGSNGYRLHLWKRELQNLSNKHRFSRYLTTRNFMNKIDPKILTFYCLAKEF